MRKLIGSRQSGRTTKILYVSHVMGYPILVADESRKTFLECEAKKKHLEIPEPITISDLNGIKARGKFTENPRSLHIIVEDAEDVLSQIIHKSIGGVIEVLSISTDDSVITTIETN